MKEIPEGIASEWLGILFILIIAVLTWVRFNYSKRFQQLFSAAINQRLMRQLMRQELVFSHRASIVLTIVFVFSLSSFLYVADSTFSWTILDASGFQLWLQYFALIVLIYLVKILSIEWIKLLADGDFGLSEYEYDIFIINKASGLFIFPIAMLGAYLFRPQAEVIIGIGFIILLGMYIYRWIRGLGNAIRLHVPVFYIILYFCTLEILPLAILQRVLSM